MDRPMLAGQAQATSCKQGSPRLEGAEIPGRWIDEALAEPVPTALTPAIDIALRAAGFNGVQGLHDEATLGMQ